MQAFFFFNFASLAERALGQNLFFERTSRTGSVAGQTALFYRELQLITSIFCSYVINEILKSLITSGFYGSLFQCALAIQAFKSSKSRVLWNHTKRLFLTDQTNSERPTQTIPSIHTLPSTYQLNLSETNHQYN